MSRLRYGTTSTAASSSGACVDGTVATQPFVRNVQAVKKNDNRRSIKLAVFLIVSLVKVIEGVFDVERRRSRMYSSDEAASVVATDVRSRRMKVLLLLIIAVVGTFNMSDAQKPPPMKVTLLLLIFAVMGKLEISDAVLPVLPVLPGSNPLPLPCKVLLESCQADLLDVGNTGKICCPPFTCKGAGPIKMCA
ncbi:hypothetical protein C0Q70_12986 [Pomacea canaliculata]|uniref:Uncharacterized protein n=1 Tax=Pomacea canaliculata TaxID=400727 RepID=A0A2T7P305_POMCA|nr:hypothetical protein C0Q70_12986 [Pomacea canaliculata]